MVKLDFDLWFPHLVNRGIIAFHDTTSFPGVRKVIIDNIYKSRNFIEIGFVGSIIFAKKVPFNTIKDRFKNVGVLFSWSIYELFLKGKQYLPKPMKEMGKKLLKGLSKIRI